MNFIYWLKCTVCRCDFDTLKNRKAEFVYLHATHVLSVSGEVGKLHHLIAKLAENLYKFLEGADSFQMVEGNQDLREVRRSG